MKVGPEVSYYYINWSKRRWRTRIVIQRQRPLFKGPHLSILSVWSWINSSPIAKTHLLLEKWNSPFYPSVNIIGAYQVPGTAQMLKTLWRTRPNLDLQKLWSSPGSIKEMGSNGLVLELSELNKYREVTNSVLKRVRFLHSNHPYSDFCIQGSCRSSENFHSCLSTPQLLPCVYLH